MPMQIRPATTDDLEAIVALFTRAVHELAAADYSASQRAAWAPRPADGDAWRNRLAPLRTVLATEPTTAAVEAGTAGSREQLAGFLSYDERGHIDLLYVDPQSARRGVATLLLNHAEAALAAAGVRELWTEASLTARPFFARRGFAVTEAQTVALRGEVFRRFEMRKSPGPPLPAS